MELSGTLVFSSGRSGDFDIWTLELASGELCNLTSGSHLNMTPRWSPDGSRIAYISLGADLISSLYVMDRNGNNQQRLTTNVHAEHPSWAPDGKSILFTANAENGDEIEICRYDLEAGSFEILRKRQGHEMEPTFSPDGRKLLFSAIDPNSEVPFPHRDTEIWEYELETKQERKICAHAARDFCPSYSPDGSRIAFISHRNGRDEEEYLRSLKAIQADLNPKSRESIDQAIAALQELEMDSDVYVVDANGENLRRLTTNEGADTDVRWSPCGNFLIYASSPSGRGNMERLKIVEVDTGEHAAFSYDRKPLMREIDADPESYLNQNFFMYLVPNFIEKPLKMMYIGSFFWGEEREPDWI